MRQYYVNILKVKILGNIDDWISIINLKNIQAVKSKTIRKSFLNN